MKFYRLATVVALNCMLAASAFAQSGLYQPGSVQTTTFDSYYAQDEAPAAKEKQEAPSPADVPVPVPGDVAADYGCGCDGGCNGCGGCCDGCCCKLECPEPNPWRLFDCYNQSNCWGIEVTGWIAASVTGNADDPADNANGPVTFIDRANEAQLNQFYIVTEKKLQDDCCGWQIGGRVDFIYGSDARFTVANGLDDDWSNQRFYGPALPQAYLEVGVNDLSVKIGHYYTIIGYEVVTAPDNFFVSHAYTMQYGEPFTHTGVLGTYKYNKNFSIIAGFDRGWDVFEDINESLSFLGGVSWTSCDDKTSIAFSVTTGEEPNARTGGDIYSNRWMYSFVLSHKFSDRVTYVLQHDNGQQDAGADGGADDSDWYGINQYLFYKINCCWTAGLRYEWFRDDDGTRVAALDGGNVASAGGFEGEFNELSLGLNWTPSDNLKIRPELRYDWYEGTNGTGGVRPYDGGTDSAQFLFAVDAIFLF